MTTRTPLIDSATSLVDSALRTWKTNIDRTGKLFGTLSEEQLLQEIAPGRNRLIYLWGHLTAVNDALLPLLGLGERLHPELDAMFVSNPDRSVERTTSGEELKRIWNEINEFLWTAFSRLTPADWLQKHSSVSEADFGREPYRNRFTILLGRTSHLAYHFGQAQLAQQQ
ncbi:MAG TPA: DinB family protein [Terriglobales bacterium]|nr:DinB family protein [Terriglobales bacterium]